MLSALCSFDKVLSRFIPSHTIFIPVHHILLFTIYSISYHFYSSSSYIALHDLFHLPPLLFQFIIYCSFLFIQDQGRKCDVPDDDGCFIVFSYLVSDDGNTTVWVNPKKGIQPLLKQIDFNQHSFVHMFDLHSIVLASSRNFTQRFQDIGKKITKKILVKRRSSVLVLKFVWSIRGAT